jgi:predicted ribosome quality control (RQC) complex YloA/Tae2 family protein
MDALLLLAVIAELHPALTGGIVRAAFSAGPCGLWLELATPGGPASLLLSVEAALPRIALGAARPPRARPLPALGGVARQILPGTRLAVVAHRGLDRVVCLDFEPSLGAVPSAGEAGAGCRVVLELFGSQPNLLLVEPGGRILEAARHTAPPAARPQGPGLPYIPPSAAARPDPRLLGSPEAVAAALEPLLAAGLAPSQALRQGLSGVSDLWAREAAARAADRSALELARSLQGLVAAIAMGPGQPHLILDASGIPEAVAPFRLVHLPDARQQPAPSLGEALERLAAHLADRQSFSVRSSALRQLLRRLEARLASRRAKLLAETEEFARSDAYQRMGEILVANQAAVPRGAAAVALPDHAAGPSVTLTIPLDVTLPAGANAERYFRLARRGRRGGLRVAGRLAETDDSLARVTALAARAAAARDPEALTGLQRELEQAPRLLTPADRDRLTTPPAGPAVSRAPGPVMKPAPRPVADRRQAGPEPRRFVSSEGLAILVGRDTEGNDHLTQHVARSEDLWLHAEGFPGSHVVIRMQDRTGGVPRQTLLEAAKLAAYYSQARTHGKVSVSYTLKKYVRKPRKSPPGLVTITHEKTVVVKPDKELVARLAQPD